MCYRGDNGPSRRTFVEKRRGTAQSQKPRRTSDERQEGGRGGRPVLLCSVGGALPHQFSPQVSPWAPSAVVLNIFGGVTSFRENPMKAMGLFPQNGDIHHTQQQGSMDPWLRSPPLDWGRPATPSPSHHFLIAPDSLKAAAPTLHPCAGSVHSVALPLSRSDPCSGALTWKEWKRYQKAQALMTL